MGRRTQFATIPERSEQVFSEYDLCLFFPQEELAPVSLDEFSDVTLVRGQVYRNDEPILELVGQHVTAVVQREKYGLCALLADGRQYLLLAAGGHGSAPARICKSRGRPGRGAEVGKDCREPSAREE
jgi:hypothetical protein